MVEYQVLVLLDSSDSVAVQYTGFEGANLFAGTGTAAASASADN